MTIKARYKPFDYPHSISYPLLSTHHVLHYWLSCRISADSSILLSLFILAYCLHLSTTYMGFGVYGLDLVPF